MLFIFKSSEFSDGLKKGIPICFGYIPMGIAYAIIALKAGLNPLQVISMSFLVYAGAGQIIAVSMLLSGASALSIILTSFIVNLRYFVMSTSVLNKIKDSNILLRIFSAHLTVDESFAIFSLSNSTSIWNYLGIALIAWLSWCLGAFLGVIFMDILPIIVSNSFNISLYALFVAILIPAIKENKNIGILVILTMILNTILSFAIGTWSIILSTIISAFIGMYIIDDDYFKEEDI